jgi:hypothetical protein
VKGGGGAEGECESGCLCVFITAVVCLLPTAVPYLVCLLLQYRIQSVVLPHIFFILKTRTVLGRKIQGLENMLFRQESIFPQVSKRGK